MAFREGVTTWEGDQEYNGLNASAYYQIMKKMPAWG